MKQGIAKVLCKCINEYQDQKYGKGIRIANTTAKQDDKANKAIVRCTVCGALHEISLDKIK